jgi:tRNA1Val (adenine37-N6)-methyltransferase
MLLYQPESGYCYNSDSLFLYDFINSFKPKGKVLDVGAGCGIVGLLVARDNSKIELEAVEKQNVFVHYAKTNARINKIAYHLHECDFLALDTKTKYDYVISNPPFYPNGVQKSKNEILYNARYNINLPLDDFCKKVSQILKPHSHFIFCYDASQFGNICVALEKVKMKVVDVQFVHPKVDKAASLVLIHARNGSKSEMKIHEPVICFEENELSRKTQKIYENANTQSIKCQI